MTDTTFASHLRKIWDISIDYDRNETSLEDFNETIRQCLLCGQSREEILIALYSAMAEYLAEELKGARI